MDDGRGPKERVYDEAISPLMSQIIATCKQHGIALVASFELDDDGDGDPLRCTTLITTRETCAELKEAARVLEPRRAMAVFAIETTMPDGSKHVRIGRVGDDGPPAPPSGGAP